MNKLKFGRNKNTESGATTPRQDGSASPNEKRSTDKEHQGDLERHGVAANQDKIRLMRPYTFALAAIVSIGGFIFGYDTGQISGFLEMPDFLRRFHNVGDSPETYAFTDAVSGTIVGLLSIGTMFGALCSAPVADRFGRKICIIFWNIIFCVGVVIQMASEYKWYQVALGRWVAGLGVGGLSVLTPMYQSETAPRYIRGAMVGCYQLFITLGIFTAYCINFGTEANPDASAWRIPMGVGFIPPALMMIGIVFLPESPRWDYRHNHIERARKTIARSYGVTIEHWEVQREMREIKEKYDAEFAGGGKPKWYEIFTGPRMAYRTLLGVTMQALQQLTGANFFFYYGTTIFTATGLDNSYVTSMILGAVNFAFTFPGLFVIEKAGRRGALIWGAAWMFMCFMVFSSVGHFALDNANPRSTPGPGAAMIVFACLFIAGYAMTWGPVIWVVVGELYPTRYRTMCMGIASSSNWIWNFLISFFSPFITSAIDFQYGYIFAACCFISIPIVYFFLEEHQGRTLEEIDTMYITHVPPRKSSKWVPPTGEDLVTADGLYLTPGARGIRKADAAGMEGEQRVEALPPATEQHGIVEDDDGVVPHASGVRGMSYSQPHSTS
ncbi:Putative major facilitator, sugar transporter, major facilitator superfamily [Septoria linicola]|uniref:Major facilitator, sugar transporter, major facilitator superfamily n=1 Tax=Septoria linicola TaxID=215465 RepID=A0A9Q9B0Q6_9PEZI|nr:Putative major facilitator, sugar transporter, major facilitator superfamily [Septoria linicola]